MKMLHLIATPRGAKSRTLEIAEEFLNAQKSAHPSLVVETLDLTKIELPRICSDLADAKYTLMSGNILSESTQNSYTELVQLALDFLAHDTYLISCPMWNFTVPYQFKHYIDIIMQPGILFKFTQNGVEGLATGKKMYCITSRGSDYSPGTYLHQYDFLEPYLRAILGMAGIHDVNFINSQPMDYNPEVTKAAVSKSKEEAAALSL